MGFARSEQELAERVSAYLKARLADAGITYGELALRMKKHGHPRESENGIKQKLKRGTFSATFLLAAAAALGLDAIVLGDV